MTIVLAALLSAAAAPSHHGFFLRMDLGFGYSDATANDTSIRGPGGAFGFSIGGNIAENLALFGAIVGGGSTADDPAATFSGVGPGITYYFMPANIFLSGSFGLGSIRIRQNNLEHRTQTGVMGRLGLGKEWFVSDSWGLGLAAYLNWAAAKDDVPNPPTWTAVSPLLAFSATFY